MDIAEFIATAPWQGFSFFWLPAVVVLCDLLVPYPYHWPHPVQAIGRFYTAAEATARTLGGSVAAGGFMVGVACLGTALCVLALTFLPFGIGVLATLYFGWSGLALGALLREGAGAAKAIARAEKVVAAAHAYLLAHGEEQLALAPEEEAARVALGKARTAVGMLVSRETDNMNVDQLYRSLAESLSENFNDAFVAPLFWFCLGGPLGLWVYKAISTADSMWGYKTSRFLFIGRVGAKLDDAAAWLPARISAAVLWYSARCVPLADVTGGGQPLCFGNAGGAFPLAAAQAKLMESPNAGWPMAVAAWLYRGRMGGLTPYHGVEVEKPVLGPLTGRWNFYKIDMLLRHLWYAGVCGAAAMILGALVFFSIVFFFFS